MMRAICTAAVVVGMLGGGAGAAAGQATTASMGSGGSERAAALSAEKLLTIGSVLAGRDAPQWMPDGSRILFLSGLGGASGLWSVSPEGGFPTPVTQDLSLVGVGSLGSPKPTPSPDGRWISYVSSKSGAPEIWLWSVADGREMRLTDLGARVAALEWSPDGKWIAFSGDRHGNLDIWKVAVPGGEVHRLTTDARYDVFPTWSPDGRHILYVRLDERWVDHDVMEIGADGSRPRLVVADTDFFDYRGGTAFGAAQPSPDGRQVLFRSLRSGWHNFWVVPRGGGEPRQIAAEAADQTDARWSPDGRQILFVSNTNGTHHLKVVPAAGGAARALVAPAVGVVARPSWSPDGRRISYTLVTPTQPEDLHVVEVGSGRSRQLTHSLPAGNLERTLVEPEKVRYRSPDGLEIPAYLYRPREIARGERLPGIMWIHGGPTSQFHDDLQLHVQFFVQRGYVVLLPNIRGSSGYGKAFEDANNGCWGHCDLQDVLAGVEYLKRLPYVNPHRMGITGTSYGGCMSLAATAFAPGVFQASIPASGYGDWIHFYHEQELRHIKLMDYEFGPLAGNEEVYRRNSPIFHIDRISTPTFLIHGEGHFPGSVASHNFAKELEKNYKVFRHKAYPNENYYIRGRENVRQMLLDVAEFFDQYLKDAEVPRAAQAARLSAAGGDR
jgi:dipeptidyl aminopeptidase/acylaminoacyl peptidase